MTSLNRMNDVSHGGAAAHGEVRRWRGPSGCSPPRGEFTDAAMIRDRARLASVFMPDGALPNIPAGGRRYVHREIESLGPGVRGRIARGWKTSVTGW